MTTGKQLAGLLLLSTALVFPASAFAQGTTGEAGAGVGVPPPDADAAGAPQAPLAQGEGIVDAQAAEQAQDSDISVPGGGAIIVTGRVRRNVQRDASQVVSVLSAEQIARTGEGDIAGALGRVSGLSVVGDGLVYVRGLGDRYSLALLNGLPLPSPEPLSRVVPLDIFPTNVIASSLVQKSYSANFPGEFGGGVINLTTRAVPEENFLTISGGISGDSETTFHNGLAYYGASTDWTGFDNGVRAVPSALANYVDASISEGVTVDTLDQGAVETLANSLSRPNLATLQIIDTLPVNFSGGITAGGSFEVGDDARLGIIATANISNEWRTRVISRQDAGALSETISRDEKQFNTDNNVLVNALLGFGLEFGEHTIRQTNLFIRDTVKQASRTDIKDFEEFPQADVLSQNTAWFERQLIDSQIVGEFDFDPITLDLRGGFARTDREAPYNLTYTYARTNDPDDPFGEYYRVDLSRTLGNVFQETGVESVFSDLNEELWYGGVDLSYEAMPALVGTIGYAYTDTDRYSQRRGFVFDVDLDPDYFGDNPDPGIPAQNQEQLLEIMGLRPPASLVNGATYTLYDVNLIDFNATDPAFAAELTIHAGYGQVLWSPTGTLSVQAGVRYEDAEQSTTPIGVLNNGIAVIKNNDYWLPGVTLTFEPVDDLQLRASGSRTIARPQFRELVSQVYFDPETNRQFVGNPSLGDSELLNLEARAEYYLERQSRVSVAGFYKEIEDPIEAYVFPVAGRQRVGFANAPLASLYGAEVDVQYSHDLYEWGGWLETKQLVLTGNYTYTQSELSVGEDDLTSVVQSGTIVSDPASLYFTDGAPLIGQSDHLVNLQLGIEDTDRLQQFTVLVSYATDRVTLRGFSDLPDVIEEPGVRLDLVLRQGFEIAGTETVLKLEARNLLGTNHEEYQINQNGLRIENNTYDVGRSFGASLSVTF